MVDFDDEETAVDTIQAENASQATDDNNTDAKAMDANAVEVC